MKNLNLENQIKEALKDGIIKKESEIKLFKIYDSIKLKNIQDEAIDQILSDVVEYSPYEYKIMILDLMKLVSISEEGEISDNKGCMNRLIKMFHFFELLDCDDFYKLQEINNITKYGENYRPFGSTDNLLERYELT